MCVCVLIIGNFFIYILTKSIPSFLVKKSNSRSVYFSRRLFYFLFNIRIIIFYYLLLLSFYLNFYYKSNINNYY